ncbi:MAG TPA: hypothetical protein VMJ10_09485 [Kofleriaceae bacterium]|nr:hypothetical protein [Kofleriaceae bacterium]
MRAALIAFALAVAPLAARADAFAQSTQPSTEDPQTSLAQARHYFTAKDWQHVIEKLTPLLFKGEKLALPGDLVEAYLLLGVAYVETGQAGDAKDMFKQVLRLEPGKTIDQLMFSMSAVRVFDETKSEVEDAQHKLDAQRELDKLKHAQEDYLKSLHVVERHPYYVNFVPFGAGQFQDRRVGLGVGLAASEGAMLFTSAGIWLYLAGKYGIESKSVPVADVPSVQHLEQVEIGTGIAFFALYAYGVVDSLYHYKPRAEIQGDKSLLPPSLQVPTPAKKQSLRDRIHIFPMANAHGAGIGIGWED